MTAGTGEVRAPWAQVRDAVTEELGVILCTVLVFTHGGARMERIFSSHPVEYPVGGWKDVATEVSPDWIAATRDAAGVFVAQTPAELDRIFGDAALIRSLGCGSILNLPLQRQDGTNWGTVNLCAPAGAFTPAAVDRAQQIVAEAAEAAEAPGIGAEGGTA